MRFVSITALLLVLAVIPLTAEAGKKGSSRAAGTGSVSEQEVLHDLEQTLDLWRDGRYDEVANRSSGGKDSNETISKKLASAPRKPACCWEKIQNAQVSLKSDRTAVVHARLGFESSVPGTQFVTKGIGMKKEHGVWTISRSDLLSLADFSGRRKVYRYIPVQTK
ncbi:MAG TPA: hypothetical protein DCZ75_13475 [Geobacter sp.]|nr:hypothetical protein [Geobacter sp.]